MKLIKSWFWSSKPVDENWAQTIVRVFGNLFRISLTLAIAAILVIASFAYYQNIENEKEISINESASRVDRTAPFDLIDVAVSHRSMIENKDLCAEQYPIVVVIVNESDRALISTIIQLEGREKGTSTNLVHFLYRELHWDTVVLPHHYHIRCFEHKLARERSDLIWSGSYVLRRSTNFSKVKQWMLDENLSKPLPSDSKDEAHGG